MAKKPSISKLSSRYAEAFFALAADTKDSSAIVAQVAEISGVFAGSGDLQSVIKNTSISTSELMAVAGAIADKAGADKLVRKLLVQLAENRRLYTLPQLAACLLDMQIAADGKEKIHIISAVKLTESDIKSIDVEIATAVGKRLSITTEINPNILGGLIIKIGSKMLDNSVKGRLERLHKHLKDSTTKAA